jgi:SOS-response transcriptional repressor LexA
MPHALTPRQREYLEYLREYIKENESSPRLEEVAEHFDVKPPTAHKTLEALNKKGYLYFGRDSVSGFFIRLLERVGTMEKMIEVLVTGEVNRYGEVVDFPKKLNSFPAVLPGVNHMDVFALFVKEDIPEASILRGDILFCDVGKHPQPLDIAFLAFGKRRFLLSRIHALTSDKNLDSIEASNQYPIPERLLDTSREQRFYWSPLALSDETEAYFSQELEKEQWPDRPIPREFVLGVVLRLMRTLAF